MHNFVLGSKVKAHELQKVASPKHGMHPYVACKFRLWFEGTNEHWLK
jgi:hypothetical protein